MARASVKMEESLRLRGIIAGIAVAAVVFALSYANGGFFPTTRAYAGLAAWWLLGAGAALGIASARSSIDRLALVSLGLFAAFAVWVLISTNWASDAERAFAQFNQVSLYVAVLAIAIVVARLVPASWLVGGVALAISAIATVALVSRLFPSTFSQQVAATILKTLGQTRLSFPLGYWNGLGIEAALAYPLLLAIMTSRRSRVASVAAAFPLPIIAAVMYLTSSRGAFVAAAVGVLMFLVLTPKRWPAFAALVLAGVGGAVAVAGLVHKRALVDDKMTTALGVHQGHRAALIIGVTCLLSALAWLGLAELGRRISTPPRVVGWALVGALATLAIVAIVAAHPVAKFDQFRSNSAAGGAAHGTATTSHLLESSGSGRWQFWSAAVSEFRAHPLNGGGAGSWQAWWLQRGSLPLTSEFAHSLYLEALGELGIIGLLLLGGAVVVGVIGAVRSAVLLGSGEIAAAAACAIAFFAAAAYDWVWQLAGIAVVGVGMLGLALGALPSQRAGGWGRVGVLRPALALVAVAAIIPQYVGLAAGTHLRNSQDAVSAGDGARAQSEALAMKALEPWAATPYFQLGLVSQYENDFPAASRWLNEAIDRSPRDWQLWARAAIIQTARGNIRAARRDLAEARRLNPNSQLLKARSAAP